MSGKDRRKYLTATTLDQGLLDWCHDNLECKLEMVVEIETPSDTIYASDRNKYVGGTFYEALLNFPQVTRTVGEWLAGTLQFSSLQLELSNVDGRFNEFLPGGISYGCWVGKNIYVKLGLGEQAATYTTVFKGTITDIGGFKRSIKSIVVIARDDYDRINKNFPTNALTDTEFDKIEDKNIGKILPVIYGSWTTTTEPSPASVKTYCINGKDPYVDYKDRSVDISVSSPCICTAVDHNLDDLDPLQFTTSGGLPTPLSTGVTYYVRDVSQDAFRISSTPGGPAINTTAAGSGTHKIIPDPSIPRQNLKMVICDNDLTSFDTSSVYLKRGDVYSLAPASEIVSVGAGNKSFEIKQASGISWVDTDTGAIEYEFDATDEFLVKVVGKDLGSYTDNIVWQARDILKTYGGLVDGDFDSNWTTYRDKSTPSTSSISTFKSRVWIGESQSALTYALSMLEQVRLEAFVDRTLKWKINSLHFEDWTSSPSYTIRNWDVVRDSFRTTIDEKNNFNRAQGVFNFLPDRNENAYATPIYKNSGAISQVGKTISKKVVFPNLYERDTVIDQLKEILRIASGTPETLEMYLTWRSLLKDCGDFAKIDVRIGSSIFDNVPCMIRDIGYDPVGLKIFVKAWSFQMTPYPGYTPGYAGTVGGYSATIDQE